jgi:hypothetical protein
MEFPLDQHERSKFVRRVVAGIFVAGSSGTEEEFMIAQRNEIKPLIPIAGARGTGALLARRMLDSPRDFVSRRIPRSVLETLANPDASAESYVAAVMRVIRAHGRSWWQFWRK